MSHRTITPKGWKQSRRFANGVITNQGEMIHVAGQLGSNEAREFQVGDIGAQWEQALRNVVAVVNSGGGSVSDIVRLNMFVTDQAAYAAGQKAIGAAFERVIGQHTPAMTLLFVSGLVDERALVEIEATAVVAPRHSNGDSPDDMP